MTSVWPALWPPWKRTTTSARSLSQSTILPLPSSPHWAPITTTFAMVQNPPRQGKPRRRSQRVLPGPLHCADKGSSAGWQGSPGYAIDELAWPAPVASPLHASLDRLDPPFGRPAQPPAMTDVAARTGGEIEAPGHDSAPAVGIAHRRRRHATEALRAYSMSDSLCLRHTSARPVGRFGAVRVSCGARRRDDSRRPIGAPHHLMFDPDQVVRAEAEIDRRRRGSRRPPGCGRQRRRRDRATRGPASAASSSACLNLASEEGGRVDARHGA